MTSPLIILAPAPALVDPLGAPLREEPRHTFSNAPSLPPVTLESVARAAFELDCWMFRSFSRYWFEGAGWRRWRELTDAQQEQALASFRAPPAFTDEGDFMPAHSLKYSTLMARPERVRPVYLLGNVAIELAPYGNPPYRRCAVCGKAKRTVERQRWPYCARCCS